MRAVYRPVYDMAGIESLKENINTNGKAVMLSGCIDTQKMHIVHALSEEYQFRVVITHDETKARRMQEDSQFFDSDSIYYPAKDFIFYSADVHGNQLAGERIRCIARIADAIAENKRLTLITTIDACVDMLLPLERYMDNRIFLKRGELQEADVLCRRLTELGYERTPIITDKGQYAVRGGIVDIFSHTDEVPVRIEFWDDEIDSIRYFDVESQRSIEKINSYTVFPATEYILYEDEIDEGMRRIRHEFETQLEINGINNKKKTAAQINVCNNLRQALGNIEREPDYAKFINYFTDKTVGLTAYFPEENTLFVLDEPNRTDERMKLVSYEYEESMKNRLEAGYIIPGQARLMRSINEVYLYINRLKLVVLSALDYRPEHISIEEYVRIDARSINAYNNSFEYLCDDLRRYKKLGYRILLICSSRTRASRISEDLNNLDISAYYSEDFDRELAAGSIMVSYGNIHKGFEYPLLKFAVITENDIFTSRNKKLKKKKVYEGKSITGFNELNIGDFVVHETHGLGIYRGVEKISVEGTQKDYVKIEYAGNSNLFVLATQLDRLQKYAGADIEKKPKLNKLGSVEWAKTKSKVHKAVEEVARDLVELYALRQKQMGYAFGSDTVWQKEFEEMFPYEETQDQLIAIEDTKRDMESTRIMDRLICGDVGYGKTEVAIRAAFKAVQEGKQVAYLVPTTILAGQHYSTFEQRMKNFPIKVALLSSFRSNKEMKETIADLKKGFVDIVIGTHRILSKDVVFKDLGLLIIDEEQRFGVAAKEKIKQLKNNIDVLTLSATPIPRTLHMSLVGIRDMSVLEEPPTDRIPIQTFVTQHNDEIIREAINRELARDGQVYFVYNKVRNIDEVTEHISKLVPDAVVAYAHGQMDKHMLEAIMYDFINGEIDVLVSTTIIETGMDISNVNTIIIEDADKFGLSQLYQLRGRVGRSNRTSYAFLLYRRDKMITEVAEKRLSAIREFSDFGSGFKIAMKDLEIRGAGNVLGKSQHGHMAAVGYDLYCKMLNEAVNDLKGIKNDYSFETNVDLTVDAYIPSSYIKSEYQKLDVYKRIAAIETDEELSDMRDELSDRYGSMPASASNLLKISLIKHIAHKTGIVEVKGGLSDEDVWKTVLKIYPKADIKGEQIEKFVDSFGGAMQFVTVKEPMFVWRVVRKKFRNQGDYLDGLKEMTERMYNMLTKECDVL